jgi:DNA-binding transcriptional MerR regulator
MRAVTLLTIGDFSRMSYLSVKTLRHYHETGLLEPAAVDPETGYRLYDAGQVRTAQVIRRFRELGMPIGEVKRVLGAPDLPTRDQIVAEHLQRMESQLEETRRAVNSLRKLLEAREDPIGVEFRSVSPVEAVAISEPVRMAEAEEWWEHAFRELYDALDAAGIERAAPGGAFYTGAFFEQEQGEVTAFVPIASAERAGPRRVEIPGGEFAVAVHDGSFAELDRTYAALGTFVADRAIGVAGPIREHYLVSAFDTDDESAHRTEVCWPVLPGGSARRDR